jgi:hypothetical protein
MNEAGATRPAQSARTPKILVIPNEVRNLRFAEASVKADSSSLRSSE